MAKKYWLMKTEPDAFSFDDLVNLPSQTDCWDGIRNYQARNMMRDDFQVGDQVFIYHSRVAEPGIVGIAKVVRDGYPDHTALDPKCKYFDPKSEALGESRWVMVDVQATHRLKKPISLAHIKQDPFLANMKVAQKGSRLSIQPVEAEHWKAVKAMGKPAAL